MDEENKRLQNALRQTEAKLWIIECELDHRETRAIKGINAVRVFLHEAMGWDVTTNESGMMVGATKVRR